MTRTRRGRVPAALTFLALTATLASCSSTTDVAATRSPAASAPATAESSAATPSATPTVEAVELTCETIVSDALASEFAAGGWTGEKWGESPWMIADQSFPEGLACIWAEDHSIGTDNISWFGWSPIDDAKADATIAALVGGEFIVDETPDGRYVSENPAYAISVDENGYGTTYLFGDGWVAGAGTRTEVGLVRVPEGWTP